ncbi:MAG: cell fate regulator YaaT (PSP1 superfamily) [Thermoproteota archaeon]|jgi:cell fate regulator YaaT (PSP1 superfamily)
MDNNNTNNNLDNESKTTNSNDQRDGFVIPSNDKSVQDRRKKQEKKVQEEIDKQDGQFTKGQILNFVRVRFPGHTKSLPFLVGKRSLDYGQKVVAMSDRGMAVGYINSFPYEMPFDKTMLPVKNISKVATEEDLVQEAENYKKQKETETVCLRLIEKYNLDMNLTHVEFTQFGKKVVYYFTAPARVDFRNLVKDLVSQLKLRIELRQISVRDRAASIGGLGPCGRQLCCSSFLSKYGNVNIKMAKNQNLTLTFSKLNGVCGQLKCCLSYENDVYAKKRKNLPNEGDMVLTRNGNKGKVIRLHLLDDQFDVLTEKGVRKRFVLSQFQERLTNFNLPNRFDHISDETSTVVGLEADENLSKVKFDYQLDELRASDPQFADDIFNNLFGAPTFDEEDPKRITEKTFTKEQDAEYIKEQEALVNTPAPKPKVATPRVNDTSSSVNKKPNNQNNNSNYNGKKKNNNNSRVSGSTNNQKPAGNKPKE